MKKKMLEKLPMKPKKLTKKNKTWVATAELIEVEGEKILLVDFYKNIDKPNKEIYPSFRLFLNKKEDFVYEPQTNKWAQRKIENIIDTSYYNKLKGYDYELADKESESVIDKYIPSTWDKEWVSKIERHQYNNRSSKSNRSYELRVARVKKAMEEIDVMELPDDFMEFVDETTLDKRYVFYKSDKNRRYIKLFCSHCKNESRIDRMMDEKPEHKAQGICGHCGSRITYIAPGYKERCVDYKEVIVMQKRPDGFVSRYYDVMKSSSQFGEVHQVMEKARVIYDGKKAKTYYNIGGSYYHERSSWWDANAGMYSYDTHITFGQGVLYYKNLDEVLKGTTFQYCALSQMAEHEQGYMINHDSFLRHFESHRFIEYFIKMGLYNLANDYVINPRDERINKNGKNVLEILKISKQQVNRLIEMNGNRYTLGLLQAEETSGARFTDEQIMFFTDNQLRMDDIEKILQYSTPTQAVRYLRVKRDYKTIGHVLTEWKDYIENCKMLGYDLSNEFVLFPRYLKTAHDNTARAAVDLINREKDKLLQERMSFIADQYRYETENFIISIPQITGEIIKEGQELHHCVGTYVERVVRGECIILFVRRKDDPETSFFTMEIKGEQIVQCRGKNNCDMPQPVKQFVESFRKKKLSIESAYQKAGDNVA